MSLKVETAVTVAPSIGFSDSSVTMPKSVPFVSSSSIPKEAFASAVRVTRVAFLSP
ncbi:MAG: hypothetical protein LIO74_10035 [Ruminococcus sp.]|nr:hypothetical protein [Ruminococcus sp.]